MARARLRTRIDESVRKWNLTVEQTTATESSVLLFGRRDNQPVVLKVIKDEGDEWHSGEILTAFHGRGVVDIYDYVAGAVLLQRAVPGESLVHLSVDGRDEEATAILADVIREMSGCAPPEGCATVHDYSRGFDRYRATGDKQIPGDLLADAQRCYAELAASQAETRLLHGDLHHYNVLSDTRLGWLAIDPKGVIGELEYEVGAAIRNPIQYPDLFTSPETVERRLDSFARKLNLDRDRALRWAFAQAVLSAIWEIEDGCAVDGNNSRVRLAFTIRDQLT